MTRAVTRAVSASRSALPGSTTSDANASVGALLDALAARLGGSTGLPARSEARDLIAAVLGEARFWPSAHREHQVSDDDVARIENAAARLARGMPFAYAVGYAQFRNLSLVVDEHVLIPRPETELLVDIVLEATSGGGGTAVDVGTGSGAIALALATEGKFDRVIGTDVSADALAVAQVNAQRVALRDGDASLDGSPHRGTRSIELRQGSYLAPVLDVRADVVVSNPPYIALREADELPALVRNWEPAVALFAEDDGMAAIGAIVRGAETVLTHGGVIALETDSRRAERAADLVRSAGCYRDVVVRNDLTGRARFVCARRA